MRLLAKPGLRQRTMRILRWLMVAAGVPYLALAAVAGVIIAEASLKLRRRPLGHEQEIAATVHNRFHAALQDVSIVADDGAVLKAWYVHPRGSNGNAVVLQHGITDNREGVSGYAELFLKHGYAVLLPDARGHGESGGELATYGVQETGDLHRWVSWLYEHDPPRCVFGFGESYGAALTLESLVVETRYCAVAVESSFSTAREMSYERISGPLHLKPWFGKTVSRPVIWAARLYARLRYGIDLLQPNPLAAVRHSTTPVLLIHGAEDATILPYHSQQIARAAPDHVQLWLVPHAGHTMAWSAAHQEFEDRVLAWFSAHQKPDTRLADSVTAAVPSDQKTSTNSHSETHFLRRPWSIGPITAPNF
ncbi:MAG TPA: alpha/beta fold hydrolase [Candidatus Angelobacter sp.]|nr:alpha/beta fold hydrolase [Candidatus Angelobacter sp.]